MLVASAKTVNLILGTHMLFVNSFYNLNNYTNIYFICCRLNLQWQDVEIGDDMIILQDMDSDDDTNKNGREQTAGQLTTKKIIKNIKNVNLKIYFWIRLNW